MGTAANSLVMLMEAPRVCLMLGVREPCVHRTYVTSAFIEYLLCEVMALDTL